MQGLHRLVKYLSIQDCLEKSLKIKFALKSTWKTIKNQKVLEFYLLQKDSTLTFETEIGIKLLCLYLVQHIVLEYYLLQEDSTTDF